MDGSFTTLDGDTVVVDSPKSEHAGQWRLDGFGRWARYEGRGFSHGVLAPEPLATALAHFALVMELYSESALGLAKAGA